MTVLIGQSVGQDTVSQDHWAQDHWADTAYWIARFPRAMTRLDATGLQSSPEPGLHGGLHREALQFTGETLTCRAFSAPPQSPSKGVCWRPIAPDNPDHSEPVTIETARSNTDTEKG